MNLTHIDNKDVTMIVNIHLKVTEIGVLAICIESRCSQGEALCDKVCQSLATGRWFSPGPPVSSTNKTDRHDIAEILLKVALNTIKQINKQTQGEDLNVKIIK